MNLPHQTIADRAVKNLMALQGVVAIWYVGSLARGDVVPGSDIDIHVAFDLASYVKLWTNRENRQAIVDCFAPCAVSVNSDFLRVLTAEGIVVDCGVHAAADVEKLTCTELKVVYHSLVVPLPQLVEADMEVQYPATPMTAEQLRQIEIDLLVVLAAVPSMFYRHEWDSARFQLDLLRVELIKLMYQTNHLRYACRYKHFSDFLPRETLAYTYADPHRRTLAQAYSHLVELLHAHMHDMPGYDGALFSTVSANIAEQLRPFWSVYA